MTTQHEVLTQSLKAGRDLARYFANGGVPQPQPSPIVLGRDEQYYGQVHVEVAQWQEGDGVYTRRTVWWVGGIFTTALALGATAIVNGADRRRAELELAARWRRVDVATLHVTNRRLALQGSIWTDIWYPTIRMSGCDETSIVFEIEGWPSTRLSTGAPHFWFVMFRKLAYDEIAMPPDEELRAIPS